MLQGVHHRADLWPSPETFDPERFMGAPPAPYTFLPFIDGPRNCLGQNLSLLESKTVISSLLRDFNFQLALSEEDALRKHKWLMPVIPAVDTSVRVTRRAPATVKGA